MSDETSTYFQEQPPEQVSRDLHRSLKSQTLCERCSKVPLNFDELNKTYSRGETPDKWYLGTLGDLRTRDCPLCQLVETMCWDRSGSWEKLAKPDSYREVHLRWESTQRGFFDERLFPIGSFICFCQADDARLVRTKGNLDDWIDVNDCKQWLSKCETRHQSECSPTPFNPELLQLSDNKPIVMRLVDVEAMCIVNPPQSCRYIALSYVWGDANDDRLVLNSKNQDKLTEPHQLRELWHRIPKTISSAITLVKDLGERYLWVDSLCLVQDDKLELAECTKVMDYYYAMATLTIVAASGTDPYAGLPGIHPTARKSTRPVKEILPGQ